MSGTMDTVIKIANEANHTMDTAIKIANEANQRIEKTAPWKMMKEGQTEAVAKILYDLVERLRIIAILISPVLPKAAHGIFDQLELENGTERQGSALLVSRSGVGEAAGWSCRRETGAVVPAHRANSGLIASRSAGVNLRRFAAFGADLPVC